MTTLYDKLFESHVVHRGEDDSVLMFIDRHLVHEVTSPQAFEGMKNAGRPVRRPDCTLATVDHNVPTSNRTKFKDVSSFIAEPDSRLQCATLEENVRSFGLTYYGLSDRRQGIVHVIGPEQGFTLPGTTLVCGDSHSSTHGAFGCLAFGIGTSEVEHVLSTQTLLQQKSKNMLVRVEGDVGPGITSKDIMLHIIGTIGTAGGTGAVIEFGGSAIRKLSMEARMSMCNMSIEGGARAGMVAPDEITFEYLKGRPMAPQDKDWDKAVAYWRTLKSDEDAHWDRIVEIKAEDVQPTVTWGTSPQDVTGINGKVPDPAEIEDKQRRAAVERSLQYMGLQPNTPMEDVVIDKVFIGSCTNSRIEDLRLAASVVRGRHVAPNVYAMIVPGSGLVKEQAEREGLDVVFRNAGFDWREAGCSMCLGMNPDQLKPGERCASTSNRNFEGRQGPGGRTHLCSPAMAAAAAVNGRLTDVRKMEIHQEGSEKAKLNVSVTGDQVQLEDAEAPRPTDSTPAAADQPADATHRSEATDAPAQSAAAPIHAASVGPVPPAGDAAASRAYTVLKGTAAPLDRQNIDTDLIIPARFLKTIKRTGLGTALFSALRYEPETNKEIPEFVLNRPEYRQSKILVVKGKNFGCGSSREHAPWALLDFGIRSVIAPSFADIFFNNTFKNGMLPIVLPQEQVDILFADASSSNPEITIDLPNQVILRPNGEKIAFDVDPFRKHCLVKGLDEIGLTLEKEEHIKKYEEKRRTEYSWLEGVVGRIKEEANQGNKKKLDW